jgi:predicted acetyltransferase
LPEEFFETLELPRKLAEGLLLRWATADDTKEIAELQAKVHSETAEPDEFIYNWVIDLMSGEHPTVRPADFTAVVDENQGGKIVSSMNLISQTWAYGGIPFGVGRPELVATLPEYRRKGLVRSQFEAIQARSASKGEIVQGITGIPWYYRQFGYEMALNLDAMRYLPWGKVSKLETGQEEVYRLRPATLEDLPLLAQLYEKHCSASLVTHLRDETKWRYLLTRTNPKNIGYYHYEVIEDKAGASVGYLEIAQWQNKSLVVREIAVLPGNPLREVAAFLTRVLKARSDELNKEMPNPPDSAIFRLGLAHPLYEALGGQLDFRNRPYAWYIRVADLPGFLRKIAPILEKRLENSVMDGHSGTLRLNFYQHQMTLVFEKGRLTEIGTFQPNKLQDGDALFPDLTFLQLVFGYRSFEELRYAFPDCFSRNERSTILLNVLFPKQPSEVNALS